MRLKTFSLVLAGAAITASLAMAVSAAVPAAAPATAPATTLPLDPYTRDLLTRLNSADAAQRDAAQKQLASIAGLMQQPEILKRLQETSADPELKDFFGQRITQIRAKEEERRLANLPPISLSVTGAPLAQVAADLSKAVGVPGAFIVENNGNPNQGGFTLEMKEKPFWEVFLALQNQHGFTIQNYGNGQPPRLYISGDRTIVYSSISGPAMAYVTGMSYQRNTNYQSLGAPSQAYLNVSLMVMVDPRVRASRFKNPSAIKAIDDEGRNYANPNSGDNGYSNNQGMLFTSNLTLTASERLGKTLTLSFDASVGTTVGDTKVTVDDILKNADKPITIGTREARITNVSPSNNYINFQINVQPPSDGRGVDYNSRIPLSVLDATGRVLQSSSISYGGMGMNIQTSGTQAPYKLEFSVPGRAVDLPVHFEFKDLPLP